MYVFMRAYIIILILIMLYSNSYYECSCYNEIDIDVVDLSHLQTLDNICFLEYFETKNDQNV